MYFLAEHSILMLPMILALIVAMIVYFFWFVKTEFQRVIERIDQSAIGIARLNRELAQSSVKALTDQLNMHDYNETYDEEEGEEEEEEEEEGEEGVQKEGEEEEGEEGVQNEVGRYEDAVADELEVAEELEDEEVEEVQEVEADEKPKKRGRKPRDTKGIIV